jgi:glycosyltransferase involved in cell wall biosynthesis
MITVSVAIITYNQAKFIKKAIESALNQETNFTYEILVGDDFSSDGTREIIAEYAQRYPDKVVAVLHPKNLGQNGLFNTLETYKKARGKYIAVFDGDDYWTDSHKLQRQVDFLEKNLDFSSCFHNATITYEDGTPAHPLNPDDQKTVIEQEDLIGVEEVWFMATSSVMFRNVITHYPDWFKKSISGDIPRYILLAKLGKIGYLPYLMSVYRKNAGGSSFTDNYSDARFLKNRIAMYQGIDQELGYRFHATLRRNIARYKLLLCEAKQYRHRRFWQAFYALQSLWMSRPNAHEHRREVWLKYVLNAKMMQYYAEIKGKIFG